MRWPLVNPFSWIKKGSMDSIPQEQINSNHLQQGLEREASLQKNYGYNVGHTELTEIKQFLKKKKKGKVFKKIASSKELPTCTKRNCDSLGYKMSFESTPESECLPKFC
ncbi:unnamed protein product [Rangifer tarandus platyrhynchus]|uniref:Uncharacterized protein n=2 Tax=Rangifer tarandus platyrhynchus TaxID=3082113 RepID=A0AC59ZU03_RANTA|nr:unnamed protein product [Rangifer tarandus platyrhynchus]